MTSTTITTLALGPSAPTDKADTAADKHAKMATNALIHPGCFTPQSYTPQSYTPQSYTPQSYTPQSYTPLPKATLHSPKPHPSEPHPSEPRPSEPPPWVNTATESAYLSTMALDIWLVTSPNPTTRTCAWPWQASGRGVTAVHSTQSTPTITPSLLPRRTTRDRSNGRWLTFLIRSSSRCWHLS
jgi:hypothetical protein